MMEESIRRYRLLPGLHEHLELASGAVRGAEGLLFSFPSEIGQDLESFAKGVCGSGPEFGDLRQFDGICEKLDGVLAALSAPASRAWWLLTWMRGWARLDDLRLQHQCSRSCGDLLLAVGDVRIRKADPDRDILTMSGGEGLWVPAEMGGDFVVEARAGVLWWARLYS